MKKKNLKNHAVLTTLLLIIFLASFQLTYGGDVVGKLVTGYQGWFSCANDNSPRNSWVHWGGGGVVPPGPGSAGFDLYPDVREYSTTYQTGFENLANGRPARLFSSYDTQVVNKHFEWMQEYGIDVAALQRFGHSLVNSDHKAHKDGIAIRVKNAAETYERKFYLMYDISDWNNFQSEIKTDWTNTITGSLNLTSSPAYAIEDGKPVVCIWGVGSNGRPGNVNSWKDVINWFKDQGCYVIVGGDKNWRTNTTNLPAWEAADMISPWHVGTFSFTGVSSWGSKIQDDMAYCKVRGIDYMPVTWPGFSWANWKEGAEDKPNQHPRMHGNFIWNQFYTAKSKFNSQGMTASVYVAMFDEYDEGTAIAKAAEDASMVPTDQWFLTLDADGVHCSSDFYLRITGDGAKMIKGDIPLTQIHPTAHTIEIAGEYFDDCDSLAGWNNNLVLNNIDKQQGSGCLEFSGTIATEFYKAFDTPYNSGIDPDDAILNFWYYVSDISMMDTNNQVELGSGGAADVSEYNWILTGLSNGWNEISLNVSDAEITGGMPDLNAINWFRVYNDKSGSLTTRIDGIKIIDSSPTTYLLIVDNGSGDGYYESGAAVTITAYPAPNGHDFDVWKVTSGSPSIADVNSSSTTLTMPSGPTTIIATYKANVIEGTYQAEDAAYIGLVFANNYEGYNGSGFLDYINPSDDYIEWTVNVPSAGNYKLFFRYALEAANSRPLELKVNGTVKEDSLDFPPTGNWATWEVVTSAQPLNVGDNTIKLTSIGSNGGNIDELVVKSFVEIIYDNFEGDLYGNWKDGGDDCKVDSTEHAHQGFYSVNLEGNTSTSLVSSNNLPLTGYSDVLVEFWYKAVSMEADEDFWLQISTNGGDSYTTIKKWISGVDFENDSFYSEYVTITDYNLTDQTRLRFRCSASDDEDDIYLDEIRVSASNRLLQVDVTEPEVSVVPDKLVLDQNYPNPFNPTTSISYSIPIESFVSLLIYDVLGRKVTALINEKKQKGNYEIEFNGGNLTSGIYYYRLQAGDFVRTRKFVLLK